ncbi:MAG: hypothetical protein ACE5LS_00190 [Thermoplasmata archaeon]
MEAIASGSTGSVPIPWVVFILAGVAVAFAGVLVSFSSTFFISYTDRFSAVCDTDLVLRLLTTGAFLVRIGTFLLIFGMFVAGARSPNVDGRLRGSLFIGGAIIFILGFAFPFPFPVSIPPPC